LIIIWSVLIIITKHCCFQDDISEIFKVADKDNSGTLTVKEIQDVLEDICIRYPQVELYLKSKQMNDIVDLLKDSKGNTTKESVELNIKEFKKALADVDLQVKSLPATAQVIHCYHQTEYSFFHNSELRRNLRLLLFLDLYVEGLFFEVLLFVNDLLGCCTTRQLPCSMF